MTSTSTHATQDAILFDERTLRTRIVRWWIAQPRAELQRRIERTHERRATTRRSRCSAYRFMSIAFYARPTCSEARVPHATDAQGHRAHDSGRNFICRCVLVEIDRQV